ncbi:ATP-binding cassette domain-containing protein [Gordonia westfalica]|uniref:ATP-binding cassette domain-containing protein n=1 Tax=Gordonia westfalica TaxID=158898 RepID=A0ABU2GVG8_9ACTN|nr:ATP-binding cassette domain-containing protein [Gordonia westfalica]MDS1115463.1 ATP-binding cassette domain-containing protein [Gordonia westfalica]
MLDINGLSVRVGGQAVLDGVTTRVDDGELVYLLGRNGTGKTTLLRTICGVIPASSGRILIDGKRFTDLDAPSTVIGMHLGMDGAHPGHTARRHLTWLARAGGIPTGRVAEVLDLVGLTDAAGRRVVDYSLGMRQRLGIAAALLGDARTLILDEPVNGLDIDGIRWLRGLLRDLADEGRRLLIASHHLDEVARTADRVVVLDSGHVAADAPLTEFIGGHTDLEEAYLATVAEKPTAGVTV